MSRTYRRMNRYILAIRPGAMKKWRQQEHRKARHAVRQLLLVGEEDIPLESQNGDIWASPADGRLSVDEGQLLKVFPEGMPRRFFDEYDPYFSERSHWVVYGVDLPVETEKPVEILPKPIVEKPVSRKRIHTRPSWTVMPRR